MDDKGDRITPAAIKLLMVKIADQAIRRDVARLRDCSTAGEPVLEIGIWHDDFF